MFQHFLFILLALLSTCFAESKEDIEKKIKNTRKETQAILKENIHLNATLQNLTEDFKKNVDRLRLVKTNITQEVNQTITLMIKLEDTLNNLNKTYDKLDGNIATNKAIVVKLRLVFNLFTQDINILEKRQNESYDQLCYNITRAPTGKSNFSIASRMLDSDALLLELEYAENQLTDARENKLELESDINSKKTNGAHRVQHLENIIKAYTADERQGLEKVNKLKEQINSLNSTVLAKEKELIILKNEVKDLEPKVYSLAKRFSALRDSEECYKKLEEEYFSITKKKIT